MQDTQTYRLIYTWHKSTYISFQSFIVIDQILYILLKPHSFPYKLSTLDIERIIVQISNSTFIYFANYLQVWKVLL